MKGTPNEKLAKWEYILFGLLAFSTAGYTKIASESGVSFFEIWIQPMTWYWILNLAVLLIPIFTIYGIFVNRSFSKSIVIETLCKAFFFSYISYGFMGSISNVSSIYGFVGTCYIFVVVIFCVISLCVDKMKKEGNIKRRD